MVMNVGDVLSVYKKTGGLTDEAGSTAASSMTGGANFGAMVKDFMGDAISALHEGEEKTAVSTVGGKTDLASVVTAMDNAEIALTEITAIRDKVISAYQTITSSAI